MTLTCLKAWQNSCTWSQVWYATETNFKNGNTFKNSDFVIKPFKTRSRKTPYTTFLFLAFVMLTCFLVTLPKHQNIQQAGQTEIIFNCKSMACCFLVLTQSICWHDWFRKCLCMTLLYGTFLTPSKLFCWTYHEVALWDGLPQALKAGECYKS